MNTTDLDTQFRPIHNAIVILQSLLQDENIRPHLNVSLIESDIARLSGTLPTKQWLIHKKSLSSLEEPYKRHQQSIPRSSPNTFRVTTTESPFLTIAQNLAEMRIHTGFGQKNNSSALFTKYYVQVNGTSVEINSNWYDFLKVLGVPRR